MIILAAVATGLLTILVGLLGRRWSVARGGLAALAAGALLANVSVHILPEAVSALAPTPTTFLVVILAAAAAPVLLVLSARHERASTTGGGPVDGVRATAWAAGVSASGVLVVHRFAEGLVVGAASVGSAGWVTVLLVLASAGHAACEGSIAAATTHLSGMSRRSSVAWILTIACAPLGGAIVYRLSGVTSVHSEALVFGSMGLLLFIAARALRFARTHLERGPTAAYVVTGFATVALATVSS